jgi:hypothetical protein
MTRPDGFRLHRSRTNLLWLFLPWRIERALDVSVERLITPIRANILTRAATALTGTASFFVLLAKGTEIAKYLTAVVATSAALDSVFRFNRKARTHEALCRGFTELSSKIAGWEPNSG